MGAGDAEPERPHAEASPLRRCDGRREIVREPCVGMEEQQPVPARRAGAPIELIRPAGLRFQDAAIGGGAPDRVVPRAAVHHQDFRFGGLAPHAAEGLLDDLGFVQNGKDDGKFHRRHPWPVHGRH